MEIQEKHIPIIDAVLEEIAQSGFVSDAQFYKEFPVQDVKEAYAILELYGSARHTGYGLDGIVPTARIHRDTKHYQNLLNKQRSNEMIELDEREKLLLEKQTLRTQSNDYPKTKKRATVTFWISIIATAVALVEAIMLFLK